MIFKTLICITLIFNVDTGVFPPVINFVMEDLSLDTTYVALLGSVVSLGSCLASVFLPFILDRLSSKKFVLTNIALNAISCFIITTNSNFYIILCNRLF